MLKKLMNVDNFGPSDVVEVASYGPVIEDVVKFIRRGIERPSMRR